MPDRSTSEVIIGVTGHRILENPKPIIAGMDIAFHAIKTSFDAERIAILSPLAEGADRIVAQRAISQLEARLIVLLPLPLDEYLVDFKEPDSKMEFRHLLDQADEIMEIAPVDSREDAYLAAGRYIIAHCDILLAIWNGRAARGRGGTGEIVSLSRERGLPLAWIHASGKSTARESTSICNEHGKVSFERFPHTFLDDESI